MPWPLLAAALPAAASMGSAIFDYFGQRSANNLNRNIAREANVFSAQQLDKQMSFQERMSNTSWQRGVQDMKSAGINPMLAFSQGGASSPSGGSVTGQTGAPMQNTHNASAALSRYYDIMNAIETNKQIKSQTRLNDYSAKAVQANARKTNADAKISENNATKSDVITTPWKVVDSVIKNPKASAKALTNSIRDKTTYHGKSSFWQKFNSVFDEPMFRR